MRKPLVCIMGACAAGKSTLGAYLLGPEAVEYKRTFVVSALNRAQEPQPPAPEVVKYCLNPKTGVAVCGDLKGGSDCINSRAALIAVRDWLLTLPAVKVVLVNSVRFSQQADIYDVVGRKDIRPVYLWFNLSEQENRKRLLSRRKGTALTPLQEQNFQRFRHRNNLNREHLTHAYGPRLECFSIGDVTPASAVVRELKKHKIL